MAFEYKNKRGVTFWLHQRGKLFFFSKNSENAVNLPKDFEVFENERTGLPMVRKKTQ